MVWTTSQRWISFAWPLAGADRGGLPGVCDQPVAGGPVPRDRLDLGCRSDAADARTLADGMHQAARAATRLEGKARDYAGYSRRPGACRCLPPPGGLAPTT